MKFKIFLSLCLKDIISFMFPGFWIKQRKLDPFLSPYFFPAHQWALRVVILQFISSLRLCWCQSLLLTSLPSPTSNSHSPVSCSQPLITTEQYFNRYTSAGHQNRFFQRKKHGKFKNLVPFGLQILLKWHSIISYCCPPNFDPYSKLNWKLISFSEK